MPQPVSNISGTTPIAPYREPEVSNTPRQTRDQKFQDLLTFGVPSAVAGAVDTFGTSLGLLDDDDISNAVRSINQDFGAFYERNRGGARLAGELATFYIPGTLAVKAWNTAGKLYNVSKLPRGMQTVGSLFSSTKYADRIRKLVQARDMQLAARGVNPAAEIYNANSLRNRAKLAGLYKNARTAEMLKESAAFELGILTTMNSSDFFYPEEFSVMDHVLMAAGPMAGVAAIDRAIGTRVLRKSLQRVSEVYAEARSPLRVGSVFPHPGNRDISLTTAALARKYADDLRVNARFEDQRTVFGRDVNVFETEIRKQIDGLAGDSFIPGITKKDSLDALATRTAFNHVREDPGLLVGTISLENLPDFRTLTDFRGAKGRTTGALDRQIKDLEKKIKEFDGPSETHLSKLQMELNRLHEKRTIAESAESYVLEADGALVTTTSRKPMFQDAPEKISYVMPFEDVTTGGVWKTTTKFDEVTGDPPITLTWTRNGVLGTGSNKTFDNLTYTQRTAAFELMRRSVDKFMDGSASVVLTPNDHFLKFDYVAELFGRYGEDVLKSGRVQLDKSFTSIDDVVYTGIKKKFAAYAAQRSTETNIKVPQNLKLTPRELAISYNLPAPPHPMLDVFEQLRMVETDLNNVGGLVEFKELMRREIGAEINGPLVGGMLRYPDTKPVHVIKRATPASDVGEYVRIGQEAHYLQTLNILKNADAYGGNLVADLMDELMSGVSSPLAKAVRGTDSILEGGQKGTGTIYSQQVAGGEMAAMQAAHTLDEVLTKAYRSKIAALFAEPAKVFGRLRQPANRGSMETFNHYVHMRRQGWDLTDEIVEVGDSLFGFRLEDTPANHTRFVKKFGRDFKPGELAPSSSKNYQPLTVDDIALSAARVIDGLDEIYLANTNVIRHAMGKGPLSRKLWHVPPKNFAGKEVAYVLDNDTGKVIQVVNGVTESNAVAAAEALIKKGNIPNARIVKQNEMQAFFDIRDEAFAEMADWTDAARQTGPSKGTSAGIDVIETGSGVLADIVRTQENHFNSILHRTRSIYFEPQLQFAQQMIARESAPGREAGHTAWQMFTNAVLGQRSLNRGAKFDAIYYGLEDYFDTKLAALHDKWLRGRSEVLAVKNPDAAYKAISDSLGEFNPFSSAADYAQRTYNVAPPWTTKQIANKVNWLTGLVALRIFDVSHAVLTLTSLGATMPGVIKALQPIAGETVEETANRIGAFGHYSSDAQQGVFSATKAMMRGIHSMWTPEGRTILKKATDQGLIAQPIAEMMDTLAALEGGVSSKFLNKMGRFVTAISDESEKLARGVSFMTGYNLAKEGLKITDDNLAMAFAHRFANETIGNYNPNNRPRMFQGAIGMPLGLFMTFMQNYYQRLFGYIENAQTRAAVVQLASQASVFGGQTIPGFEQYVDYFASNYDGSVDPVTKFRQAFGDEASNVLFYGSLSTLPKLFGASDGIALYQRGDVNIRSVPSLVTPGNTPVVSVWSDMFRMIGETAKQIKERNGLSMQQTAEMVGAFSPNRMLRSAGQLYTSATSGHVVDRRGAVVSADTELGMSTVARLLGFRPLSEAHASEQYYSVRAAEAARASKMENLRATVRADIRAGNFSEAALKRAIAGYINYGGSPDYFVRWYREQVFSAEVDRSLLKLKEVLNNPNKMRDVWRLMSALQMAPVDPEFSE